PVNEQPAPQHNTESVETGLKVIKADVLWRLGFTGAGRTVMHIDTGVDGLHPALAPRWWGNNGRPWYHSWFDPISPSSTSPFDCGSHGTHTMGIMCGRNSATGDTIGVAPDAYWMSAGITDCPGASYPSMNILAYQWAMDADTNAATTFMPDVISCSWQDPNVGGTGQCTSIYVPTLAAVEAAGIAVCFSAGNSGPGVSTVTPPKNINTDSLSVFSVGAVDGNTAGTPIASFSSRGPSICGGSGTLLIKPEVSAPGVNVRSSVPNNGYTTMSGTSMASPHVAGSIALLKQVAPGLTGKQIKAALFSTAIDLGTPGEDNDYGKGLIDIYAAFQQLGVFPLNAFNLQSPSTGSTIVTFPNSNVPITITWDTSATGAQYKWVFGSPVVPPRRLTIPSITNTITMTSGQLDNLLANSGLAQGDSLVGQWDVWSFRVNPIDSMKATNGPRALTLRRGIPQLTAFSLSTPPNGTTVETTPTDFSNFKSSWVRSGQGTKYKWFFASPDFSASVNIKAAYQADNGGFDTVMSVRRSKLDSLAASLGAGNSDSVAGQWRVYAYSGNDSLASSQTYNMRIKRLPIATITIGSGTADESYPLNRFYNYYRWQGLYLGSEIGTYGQIRKIKFYQNNSVSGISNENLRIFMKTTTDQTLPTASWDTTGMTLVFSGVTTSLAAPGWQEIQLTNPIFFNPTQNIMISIGRDFQQYVSSYPKYAYSTSATYLSRRGQSDTQYPLSLTQSFNRANIQFEMSLTTDVSNNLTGLPETFSLSQNYPNPFNPVTIINYQLPVNSSVKIRIYDVLGKEVMTLVDQKLNAGKYSVEFNGNNLASGAYFYRLEAGEFTDIKRMILLK
ncbi:MAG: S8/S53 family peptidase, partial [bacterium]